MIDVRLLLAALPGDAPQGLDPKYESAYGVLQDEIKKLSSVSGGAVDWAMVVSSATQVLTTLAKDIPAAGYLAVALAHTEGLAGWTAGTRVFAGILETYWENAYPPVARIRARVNTLDWWKERSRDLIASWNECPPFAAETLADAIEAVAALDAQVSEHMSDQLPLRELQEMLQRLPVVPAPVADAPTESATPSTVAQQTVTQSATPSSQSPPSLSPKDVDVVLGTLHTLAHESLNFLCNPEPTADPLVWKLVYASHFGKIVNLPPADGGVTSIPGPDTEFLGALRLQLEGGHGLQAATGAVAFAPACPLWLDVQRCVAEGLAGAGAAFAGAQAVVRQECAALVERLPELVEMAFADGTPFADPQTKAWLQSLKGQGGEVLVSPEEAALNTARKTASAQFAAGNVADALKTLEAAVGDMRGKNGEVCLRLCLQQIALLCRSERFDLAAGLADEAVGIVETHGLETWNPPLALEVWKAACSTWNRTESEEFRQKARMALLRVARLSPSAAVGMSA